MQKDLWSPRCQLPWRQRVCWIPPDLAISTSYSISAIVAIVVWLSLRVSTRLLQEHKSSTLPGQIETWLTFCRFGALRVYLSTWAVSRVFGHFFTLISMEILTWRMASLPTWEVINFYIVAKVAQILNKARNNWWFTLRQGLSINILRIKMTLNYVPFNSLLRIILIWFQNLHPSNPGHYDLQSSVSAWLVCYCPWGTTEVFLCFTKSSHFSLAALFSFQNTCHECLKGVVGPRPVELALL